MQRKLLLVDDEVGILRALRRLFRRAGYEISIAESAEEALELVATEEIPVILSDFRMPGADGGELLQRAAEIDPACVGLILSGFAELKQVLGVFNSGAVHRFVSKPWIDEELMQQVQSAFEIAEQKRSQIDLDRRGLLDNLAASYARLFPLNLVDRLDTPEGAAKELFAVEFVSPRILLADQHLDSKVALAMVIETLIRTLPNSTIFSHWNGYTLMLLVEAEHSAQVAETLENQKHQLRWCSLNNSDKSGADRIRQTLIQLAMTESDKAEFASSCWQALLNSQLTATIARAIKERSFHVVFQPICSDNGELKALEALIRCPAVTDSAISLSELIRHIDLLGYTDLFTELQLAAAVIDFQNLAVDPSIRLILNLSLRQCGSPHLQSLIKQHMESAKLELKRLSIDVSEAVLRSRTPWCVKNLEWLRQSGIQLTLDDQGAAHTYFNTEDGLAVDCVKLDRDFLRDLDTNSNRQEMLLNLCDRIQERGKDLSFEGVESGQQLNYLKEHFQFTYQGFALAQPMDARALARWVDSHQRRAS